MAAPYQYALIGKFSHGYPTMTRLRAKFAALGLIKGFKIGVLDNKHWTPDFDPNEESHIMPIWIKVLGLKPHWFHRQFLFHVASIIGKPLKLDEATSEIENPAVARICVEINVMEKLQSEIPVQVEGKTSLLRIQYEGIPEYGRICRHRGHTMASYPEVFIKENNGKRRGNNEADEQDDRISQETNKDGHEGKNKSETVKEVSSSENSDQNSIGMAKETPGLRMKNSDIGLDMGDEAQNKLTSFLEESRQMLQLGYEVQVPNTEDESQESESNESGEDIWQESQLLLRAAVEVEVEVEVAVVEPEEVAGAPVAVAVADQGVAQAVPAEEVVVVAAGGAVVAAEAAGVMGLLV
ncbi:hypothetical protein BUALT_Bualt03G0093300 [Buddleja alternifolia]|uniref:DUF4283 domain-containing protein n=1 Tax=Buddleja alternifolia TaxID=168488 RepID=A0AAV6XSC3_9LAMI|nr:hypothetical protein BUALT_Bualt03G0093300 [Buddleja alternifolia]